MLLTFIAEYESNFRVRHRYDVVRIFTGELCSVRWHAGSGWDGVKYVERGLELRATGALLQIRARREAERRDVKTPILCASGLPGPNVRVLASSSTSSRSSIASGVCEWRRVNGNVDSTENGELKWVKNYFLRLRHFNSPCSSRPSLQSSAPREWSPS